MINIKNKYISISNNKNIVTLKNMILNKYLSLFSKCQYDENFCKQYGKGEKALSRCYIKLDVPINKQINSDVNLSDDDFDIYFGIPIVKQTGTNNYIEINYSYSTTSGYFYSGDEELVGNLNTDMNEINNRKVTAIGFGNKNGEIFTIVDTDNYNIYISDGYNFRITRCDTFSTDSTYYNTTFPLHLSPLGNISSVMLDFYYEDLPNFNYGIIYSVGFSSTFGILENEFVIGKDIEIETIDDYSFKFVLSKKVDKTIYPSSSVMPGSNKYPTAYVPIIEFYPRLNSHPSSSKYPLRAEYKFIVIKYKEYFINEENEIEFTGNEYMMYYYNETNGIFNFVTKIERGDE